MNADEFVISAIFALQRTVDMSKYSKNLFGASSIDDLNVNNQVNLKQKRFKKSETLSEKHFDSYFKTIKY